MVLKMAHFRSPPGHDELSYYLCQAVINCILQLTLPGAHIITDIYILHIIIAGKVKVQE